MPGLRIRKSDKIAVSSGYANSIAAARCMYSNQLVFFVDLHRESDNCCDGLTDGRDSYSDVRSARSTQTECVLVQHL